MAGPSPQCSPVENADHDLNQLVARAKAGDRIALEGVVRAVQDDVFDLALRMLGHVDDASDASQEILVRLVTKLDSFRGESRFRTWVYRVAAHALLNYRTHLRRPEIDFEEAAGQLETALANAPNPPTQSDPAHKAPVNEVKLACAAGMLICLDRAHRLAYILGEVLELPGEDAAALLEISPVGFRKRLSRAPRTDGGIPALALRDRQPIASMPMQKAPASCDRGWLSRSEPPRA